MCPSVAIGPATGYPSWHWVGADPARELNKYFKVVVYDREMPQTDVCFIVKRIPSPKHLDKLRQLGSRIIYMPIDAFRNEAHILEHANVLSGCDLIIVHSESLLPYFKSFAPTLFVDHYGKYFLPQLRCYLSSGYALWVGAAQNLPYLLQYLETRQLDLEIRILSDIETPKMQRKAAQIADRIGMPILFEPDKVNGHRMYAWSPELQEKMFVEAKAAIDIKGTEFNQQHKPPTKILQYICSGIPVAINGCAAARYFAQRGLAIPDPSESRWLTPEYHEDICRTAKRLRPELTVEAIGVQYKRFVEFVLEGYAAETMHAIDCGGS
jgi:hypothetical protein